MSASDRLRLGSLAPLQCLQQIANDKRERERLALLGDRVLSLHVSELLLQRDATASAGEVTIRKLCYEMAASHAAFLRSTADAAALFAAAIESGSEHSLSTHFEALVGLLYGTGAHLALLDPFVRWCEVHAPPHQRCVSLALLPRSLLDVMLDLDTGHLVWSDASAQRPQESAAIDERLVSAVGRAVRPQPIVVTPQTAVAIAQSAGSWQPIVSSSTSRSHPAEAVVAVEWRSIQQYDYRDFYFPCCSAYVTTHRSVDDDAENAAFAQRLDGLRGSLECGLFRLSPSLQDAVHPGRLRDIVATKRHGGGIGSHARGKPAPWSCCGWLARDTLPGCRTRGGMVVVMVVTGCPISIELELCVGDGDVWLPHCAHADKVVFFVIAESSNALAAIDMYVRKRGGSKRVRVPAVVRISEHSVQFCRDDNKTDSKL